MDHAAAVAVRERREEVARVRVAGLLGEAVGSRREDRLEVAAGDELEEEDRARVLHEPAMAAHHARVRADALERIALVHDRLVGALRADGLAADPHPLGLPADDLGGDDTLDAVVAKRGEYASIDSRERPLAERLAELVTLRAAVRAAIPSQRVRRSCRVRSCRRSLLAKEAACSRERDQVSPERLIRQNERARRKRRFDHVLERLALREHDECNRNGGRPVHACKTMHQHFGFRRGAGLFEVL